MVPFSFYLNMETEPASETVYANFLSILWSVVKENFAIIKCMLSLVK